MNIGKLFKRFWAYCFDSVIVFSIFWIMLFIIITLSGYSGINFFVEATHKILTSEISLSLLMRQAYILVIFYLIYGLLYLIYEISFLSSKLSATPGKLLLHLEVVCYNKSSFKKILIRSLLKVAAILIPPLTLAFFIFSSFNKTKQSLHDKLSNTCVIAKNNSRYAANPQMTLEEFFEEMKSRGLRLYSEQKALSQEIYGTPIPLGRRVYEPTSYYSMYGVFVIIISLALSIGCAVYFLPDLQKLYALF